MSERVWGEPVLRAKVTETDFQTSEEETLPIPEVLTVLTYHGAPIICDLRQAPGAGFQRDQVAKYMRDEFTLSFSTTDG